MSSDHFHYQPPPAQNSQQYKDYRATHPSSPHNDSPQQYEERVALHKADQQQQQHSSSSGGGGLFASVWKPPSLLYFWRSKGGGNSNVNINGNHTFSSHSHNSQGSLSSSASNGNGNGHSNSNYHSGHASGHPSNDAIRTTSKAASMMSRESSASRLYYYSSGDDEPSSSNCLETRTIARRRSPAAATTTASSKYGCPIFSMLVFVFAIIGLAFYISSRSVLVKAVQDSAALLQSSQRLDIQVRSAEKDVKMMKQKLQEIRDIAKAKRNEDIQNNIMKQAASLFGHRNDDHPSVQSDMQEVNELQKKLTVSVQRAELLKEQVQETSRLDAIAKYGEGVHRVEIELLFPDGKIGPTKFVLEMASVEYMPHSVFMFLEMVSNHLLEGCSFILNALHVIKWAPLPYDGSPAFERAALFREKGLQSVAFHEYSPKFPHTKYTVGFAADGSPSFFINTEDNTQIHLGDPCFGKIISGFDAIKRLENSPIRNGIW
eukprot:CAMPEP_0119562466 /NCGR_PEP_ID=MMETSP1352-20130426/20501_1 /TAXON_ID=265584 /ORGANISM="Stauroneis constricta, Strain CCMP1120" /LENGTH=488 /DNA_ID=CAMNT_0007610875 /DNA_START=197 /DNA_END=1660 /DNA_ORIENTATION=+